MINKIMLAFGGALVTALVAALGVDIYEHHKVAQKVGISVNELGKVSSDTIKEALVEKAVECAAERSVEDHVRKVKHEIMTDAREEIKKEVRLAVEASKLVTQKEVLDKISEEASKIDISELKKSARDKAEEKILNKFDENLEDLLGKFNDQLDNVQRIYSSIKETVVKGQERDKGVKFTIG